MSLGIGGRIELEGLLRWQVMINAITYAVQMFSFALRGCEVARTHVEEGEDHECEVVET